MPIPPDSFSSEAVKFRVMRGADLPGADKLRRLAGWNQTLEDWQRLRSLEPAGCFVALHGQTVVGTVTTTTYGTELAWIGMMLVHPEHRRKGIATQMMELALGYLKTRGIQCVKLDATPAGRPLYEKLGFALDSNLTRHRRVAVDEHTTSSLPQPDPPGDKREIAPALEGFRGSDHECSSRRDLLVDPPRDLRPNDWPAVEDIDAAALGARRSPLLCALARDSLRALVWPPDGPISGWGLLRAGSTADYLGPVECLTDEAFTALSWLLVRSAATRNVIWDVPDDHLLARNTAQALGFAPVRPLTRMYWGAKISPPAPQTLFAIAGPAVG